MAGDQKLQKKVRTNQLGGVAVTAVQAHPPILAYSDTADYAVRGANTVNGPGVSGSSAKGDGVHGESGGAGMSAVAGVVRIRRHVSNPPRPGISTSSTTRSMRSFVSTSSASSPLPTEITS